MLVFHPTSSKCTSGAVLGDQERQHLTWKGKKNQIRCLWNTPKYRSQCLVLKSSSKCHDVHWRSEVEAEIKVQRSCCLEEPTAFLSKTAAGNRDTATQMWAQAYWVS